MINTPTPENSLENLEQLFYSQEVEEVKLALEKGKNVPEFELEERLAAYRELESFFERHKTEDAAEMIVKLNRPALEYRKNRVKNLPESIKFLKNLRGLTLTKASRMTKLPDGLTELENLEVLELKNCLNLASLPEDLFKLTNLTKLELFCPLIKTLPENIAQLTKLEELEIRCAQLESIPEELVALPQLKRLVIESEEVTRLPASIKALQQLMRLSILCPQLVELPEDIGGLKQLYFLEIGKADFLEKLPKSITRLELSSIELGACLRLYITRKQKRWLKRLERRKSSFQLYRTKPMFGADWFRTSVKKRIEQERFSKKSGFRQRLEQKFEEARKKAEEASKARAAKREK